jgi:hypothetical protein
VRRQSPDEQDRWYQSSRFWFYSRHTWDPRWWHKWGVPSHGGDEWGRRTIVWGVGLLGYVVWAYRTCWCQECHGVRAQTYEMALDRWRERYDKIESGQCLCENLEIYRDHHQVPEGPRLVPWQPCPLCGHEVRLHSKFGECTHLDTSMRSPEKGLPEILR